MDVPRVRVRIRYESRVRFRVRGRLDQRCLWVALEPWWMCLDFFVVHLRVSVRVSVGATVRLRVENNG